MISALWPRIPAFSSLPAAFSPRLPPLFAPVSSFILHPSSFFLLPWPKRAQSLLQACYLGPTWELLRHYYGILAWMFHTLHEMPTDRNAGFSRQARFGPQQPAKAGVPPRGRELSGLRGLSRVLFTARLQSLPVTADGAPLARLRPAGHKGPKVTRRQRCPPNLVNAWLFLLSRHLLSPKLPE